MNGDEEAYGEVLGQYFEVAAAMARVLDESGNPEPSQVERYERLRERKRELRSRLERIEAEHDPTDIEAILERALATE